MSPEFVEIWAGRLTGLAVWLGAFAAIRSIRADVFLWVRGKLYEANFESPLGSKASTSMSLIGPNGALVTMRCVGFESSKSGSGADKSDLSKIDGRTFKLTFSWPSGDLFETEEKVKYWIERTNASTAVLDSEMIEAIISLPPSDGEVEITKSSCIVTINGNIRRKFIVPQKAQTLGITCPVSR